jgi:hypothetical protein
MSKHSYQDLEPVILSALGANPNTPKGRLSAWKAVTAAGHDLPWNTFKRMAQEKRSLPKFPTWNEVMKEGENSPIRYAQRARVEVTYKDVDLKVRPSVSAIRTAKQFRDIPVAVTQEDIDHAYKDHLKAERFRMLCEEEGIPGGRKEMPDGSVEFYQPDAMGYPTHVLTQYPNGETS